MSSARLPLVEIFETVEGEGTGAGFPTVFVRLYGCNLRCVWCDTPYSYAPAKPERTLTIAEIVDEVRKYGARRICLTGGEPLLYGERSAELIEALVKGVDGLKDLHIETNGAIGLQYFLERIQSPLVRYIMDYKLTGSGEKDRMITENLALLRETDELKFVIADEADFEEACAVLAEHPVRAQVLFSPVWETMPPDKLVRLMLDHRLADVKLNLQLHKVIWDSATRGV